jgi:hypothetical protein
LTDRYDDPHFQPPADISGAEARAYEEKIVAMLREVLGPRSGPVITVRSVELRGERPDTDIVFRYEDRRRPGARAARFPLWKSEYPTDGAVEFGGKLHDAASVSGWIYSAWLAGELEHG